MATHPVYVYSKRDGSDWTYGLMNKNGKIIVDQEFREVERFKGKMSQLLVFWYGKNQKGVLGWLSEDGTSINVKKEYEIKKRMGTKSVDGLVKFELTDSTVISCDNKGEIVRLD